MAFTQEILNPIFENLRSFSFYQQTDYINNCNSAFDYLSGKSPHLPSIAQEYENTAFGELAVLFSETTEWTSNDDLLFSFFQIPEIQSSVFPRINYYITAPVLNSSDPEKALEKNLKLFRKLNYTIDDIVKAYFSTFDFNDDIDTNHPVYQYLLKEIKNTSSQFISSLKGINFSYRHWNSFIDTLLDNAMPEKAEEYLTSSLTTEKYYQKEVIKNILELNAERFLPYITSIKDKLNTSNPEQAEYKYELELIIFQYNNPKNPDILVHASEEYLKLYTNQMLDTYYEQTFQAIPTKHYKLSTCAFYYVLNSNKVKALEYLSTLFSNKFPLNADLIELIQSQIPENALEYLLQALQIDTREYNKRYYYNDVLNLISNYPQKDYIDELWKLESYKSKVVKDLIVQHLIRYDANPIEKALPLLQHKKAEVRQLAVIILSSIGTETASKAISNALEKEKNDDARDAMLYSLGDSQFEDFKENDIHELVEAAKQKGKLSKPIADWLEESQLPSLYLKSGKILNTEEIRFLIYRMSRTKEMRSDIEAKLILNLVDREKSPEFSKKLFKLYSEKGFDVKYKYLLALAALTGNHELADKLKSAINEWIESGRKAMCEYGIGALAIIGSNNALRWVEWYSRKYKSKKAYVGETALNALQSASDELGITMNELGDRVIPNFGFDGLFKSFEAGGEEYRAFIDSNFKIAFFNEDNKKIKSLPAAADSTLKEEFKNIAKEVKDIVKSQSSRLEHYLTVQRKWTFEAWSSFFLNNPVMFIYATKIVWSIYKNNSIQNYFLCLEDTSLVDVDDNEIELEEGTLITMAHPYFMQDEELIKWKKKVFELSIEPIFPQLGRSVTRLKEENKDQKIISEFLGKETESGAIKSTLERKGWGKGETGDGGIINEFKLDDYDSDIRAIIEVEGVSVAGYSYDYDPKLGRLYFINKKIKENNRWFNYPENDSDERLLPLSQIPPVFYSEVMADIKSIKEKKKEVI